MNKLFIVLLSLLTIYSCKDSETFVPDPAEKPFKASAFVEITDINGNPLQDVMVKTVVDKGTSVIVNEYGVTDAEGVYYLKDIDMYSSTYLVVDKPGFFHGSRRFYPAAGKTHYVRIVLLDEQYVGSIQTQNGGTLNVNDKVTLEFPANGIVTKSGQAYSGEVRVTAQPISADDEKLSDKMPGALVGINTSGEKGALASLGMIAVELTSTSGEELQLQNGNTVTMKMKVPNDKMSTAPSTISMWYFDEEAGYWKQEGTASLVGNEYVAELPHFSFWNCDAWFELVKWGATFVYDNGEPATQINVCLNILSMNAGSCGITNENGFVCGAVPANEAMLMEVRSPCGEVIYSQQIGPYSDTTMIGPITIPGNGFTLTTVHGTAVDCNNAPLTNGFASIRIGNARYFAQTYEPDGSFGTTIVNCNNDETHLRVYDEVGLKESLPFTYPYATDVDAGTISVCEDLTELIDLEVVGLPDHIIYYFPIADIVSNLHTNIYSADSLSNFQYFFLRFQGTTEGTYAAPDLTQEIGFQFPNGDRAYAADVVVTITHFGDVGDYIIGTLTGTWHTGPNGQGGPDYPLQGTFNVLRQ